MGFADNADNADNANIRSLLTFLIMQYFWILMFRFSK